MVAGVPPGLLHDTARGHRVRDFPYWGLSRHRPALHSHCGHCWNPARAGSRHHLVLHVSLSPSCLSLARPSCMHGCYSQDVGSVGAVLAPASECQFVACESCVSIPFTLLRALHGFVQGTIHLLGPGRDSHADCSLSLLHSSVACELKWCTWEHAGGSRSRTLPGL